MLQNKKILGWTVRNVCASSTCPPATLQMAEPPPELPVFDVAAFRSGGLAKEKAITQLRATCERHGFLYLANHGVDEDVQQGVVEASRRFFKLPLHEKQQLSAKFSKIHPRTSRGYIAAKEEILDPRAGGDVKELIDIGREGSLADADTPFQGPNNWPDSLPEAEFKEPVLQHQNAMWELAREMTVAFALSLDLPENYFASFFDDPIVIHRINYYPAYVPTGVQHLNCGEHTDYGFLTLLQQVGQSASLQVHVGDGKWVTAPNVPGMLNLNIGDLLEIWSNGRYRATLHRVVASSPIERFSIPFFLDPNYDAIVSPLPTCISAERPAQFKPVHAGRRKLAKFEATWSNLESTAAWDSTLQGELFKPSTWKETAM